MILPNTALGAHWKMNRDTVSTQCLPDAPVSAESRIAGPELPVSVIVPRAHLLRRRSTRLLGIVIEQFLLIRERNDLTTLAHNIEDGPDPINHLHMDISFGTVVLCLPVADLITVALTGNGTPR